MSNALLERAGATLVEHSPDIKRDAWQTSTGTRHNGAHAEAKSYRPGLFRHADRPGQECTSRSRAVFLAQSRGQSEELRRWESLEANACSQERNPRLHVFALSQIR